MQSHSSIFSFDSLHARLGWARGLLTAIVLLIILDIGLSRADWPYRRYPLSFVGEFLSKEQALRNNPVAPRIIILGNSRSKAGLIPREMERILGLPEGSVLNLSLASGDHYDNNLFQKRNRQWMKPAPMVVYAVDAFQWNDNLPLSDRFDHFAGLADRLHLQPNAQTLFGWIFRTEVKTAFYRGMFRRIQKSVKAKISGETSLPDDTAVTPAPLGPVQDRITFWYKQFKLSPTRQALVEATIRTAQEDRQQVVVLQLPFRDEYMRELRRSHGTDYDAYLQSVRSLGEVHLAIFERASDCGLSPSDFGDWDHLNDAGSARFTEWWCNWLITHRKDATAILANNTN